MTTLYVTAWHSGKWPGGTFGLRFGQLRHELIDGKPSTIALRLEGTPSFDARLTNGFWKDCPEVRNRLIGEWISAQGLKLPWPIGKPPRFAISKIGPNRFAVARAV